MRDDARYKVGESYDIYFQLRDGINENYLGKAIIRDIRHFKLNELNVFMSHIDMGLHPIDGKKELLTMYEDQVSNWASQELSYILLENQEAGIRSVIPDRIRLKNPSVNLFNTVPFGYEIAK
ncbi:hypothetical protein DYU05_04050 [Mucilaginibacter terrenus]|uniref:Uncharacterized protein n=1 Tax=Mucilaginibacter terrenus TaxID=2482727 RepID=A0A3E2NUV2_9SPHI|nr:hypothetical protein DYU05_04050 [Mucilaginibacter terrenus]